MKIILKAIAKIYENRDLNFFSKKKPPTSGWLLLNNLQLFNSTCSTRVCNASI